jgi:hypothetical protein
MADTPKSETFDTPSGPVTAKTQTVEPVPQEVVAASPEEIAHFEQLALLGWEFVAVYLGHEARLSLESLDEAFRTWQLEPSLKYSADQVIQVLGAYLGQRLSADLNMEWVKVTDEYGTDYAVQSRQWEVLSFPFAAVGKRIQDSQCDFLVPVYHTVAHALKNGDHMPRKA